MKFGTDSVFTAVVVSECYVSIPGDVNPQSLLQYNYPLRLLVHLLCSNAVVQN